MVIDQHLIGMGATMAGGGNGRARQGIHETGLSHPRAPQQANQKRAFGNGVKLVDQFEAIIEEALFSSFEKESRAFCWSRACRRLRSLCSS